LVFNSLEFLDFSFNGDIFGSVLGLVFSNHSLDWNLFFSLDSFVFHISSFIGDFFESGFSFDGLSQLSSRNLLDGKGALANERLLVDKIFGLSVLLN
jgi:hypothetical protein